jgi:argininosuccinate lyase
MTGKIAALSANKDRMRELAAQGYSTATDLADWLVRTLGMPFRDAHHVTGRAVKLAEEKGCMLDALSLEELQAVDARITAEVFDVLSVEASVKSRTSTGGTAPDNVRAEAAKAKERFA